MIKTKLLIISFFILLIACNEADKTSSPQKINNSNLAKLIAVDYVLTFNEKNPPDFMFKYQEKKYSFLEYIKNKNVILNFWSSHSPSCRKELIELEKVSSEYKNSNWIVIGISLDNGEISHQIKTLNSLLQKHNIHYLNLYGDKYLISNLAYLYGGVSGLPTTYFINSKGTIYNKQVGTLQKAGFEELMNIIK